MPYFSAETKIIRNDDSHEKNGWIGREEKDITRRGNYYSFFGLKIWQWKHVIIAVAKNRRDIHSMITLFLFSSNLFLRDATLTCYFYIKTERLLAESKNKHI